MSYPKEEIPESEPPESTISEAVPPPKKKRESVKMTDKQKSESEMKSHRMKMMGRMRRGASVNKAHKDITSV